jgi:flagellum-specific ATP synthase
MNSNRGLPVPNDSLRSRLLVTIAQVEQLNPVRGLGKVVDCIGLVIESDGPAFSIGDLCEIKSSDDEGRLAQVIGFRGERVLRMPLEEPQGLRPGDVVRTRKSASLAPIGSELLGLVIDGFSRPLDDQGPLRCTERRSLYSEAPRVDGSRPDTPAARDRRARR